MLTLRFRAEAKVGPAPARADAATKVLDYYSVTVVDTSVDCRAGEKGSGAGGYEQVCENCSGA